MKKLIEEIRNLIEQHEDNGDTLPLAEEILDVVSGSDWFDVKMAQKFQQGVDIGKQEGFARTQAAYRERTPQNGW